MHRLNGLSAQHISYKILRNNHCGTKSCRMPNMDFKSNAILEHHLTNCNIRNNYVGD